MSIHEQITALLDGELTDAGSVGELMHVLAVSPEKRTLLVEQLAMKRMFGASAMTAVPPAAADLAIMRGIGAIDAGLAGSGAAFDRAPAPIPIVRLVPAWRTMMLGAAATVLMLGAFGAGYFMRGDGVGSVEGALNDGSPAAIVRIDETALATARDSISLLSSRLEALAAASTSDGQPVRDGGAAGTAVAPQRRNGSALASTASGIGSTSGSRSGMASGTESGPASGTTSRIASGRASDTTSRVASGTAFGAGDSDYLKPAHPRPSATLAIAARGAGPTRASAAAETSSISALEDAPDDRLGVQLGMRNNFRLSLPRVYGLTTTPTILQDRELFGSLELGGIGAGPISRMRVGAAFGQTQFSMVFHSNTGGEEIDTVYEQSPQPFYGRLFVAPELMRIGRFAGLLEVGGGYSGAGGFGTVGLNLEVRPSDEFAVHAGASTWLLWTSFRDAVDLSTNVNAHIGVVYGF